MKNILMRHLLLLLPVVAAANLIAQSNTVDLYIQPDVSSKAVGKVALDDPTLGQPTPVLEEAKAALGWHYANYEGEVDGFVPDSKIGKDLLPVDNAIIFSEASRESTVLGVYRTGDSIEVVDTGIWWKLRVKKGFPVYFVLDAPSPIPAVTGVSDEVTPAPEPSLTLIEEPEPVITDASVEDQPVITPGTTVTDSVQVAQTSLPRPGILGQSYEGIFKQSKRGFGIRKPKTAYYLESIAGKRIAWIDTDEIVLPGSMQNFINRRVVIHGERTTDAKNSNNSIIHARNMRLK
ncbi:MAG: SH3 domain-containing protein [Puniceicoccaceae bacterium]